MEGWQCNGVWVYNEHKGFGALIRDKIPYKGKEEAERNPCKDELRTSAATTPEDVSHSRGRKFEGKKS